MRKFEQYRSNSGAVEEQYRGSLVAVEEHQELFRSRIGAV